MGDESVMDSKILIIRIYKIVSRLLFSSLELDFSSRGEGGGGGGGGGSQY
jgi:hypothetical protein